MRFAVTDDPLVRLAHRGERERIGRRARRHPHRLDIGFEQVGKSAIQLRAQRIAIIGRILPIGLGQRFQQLGVYRRGVIREKSHGLRMAQS